MSNKINAIQDNPSHLKQIVRINKISGQLNGIKKMIEDKKYCIDILHQLKAVKSAFHSLETEILKEHLDFCVKNVFENETEKSQKLKELLELFSKIS